MLLWPCIIAVVMLSTAASPIADDYGRLFRRSMYFMREYLRPMDEEKIGRQFLSCQVGKAIAAWKGSPWREKIPEIMFMNDILPYAPLTEEADDFRGCRSVEGRKFSRFMRRVVAGCKDVTCAVETLNREAWSYTTPPIKFASGTGSGLNAYSLYEVIERKNSSCTGLSIFLVSALRAVGVPARIVGTPHWNLGPDKCPHGDADDACGNHNWVEAFIPDLPYRGWVMVDQANAKSALNASWFSPIPAIYQIDGTMNHSIYASSYAPPEMLQRDENYFVGIGNKPSPFGHFALVWDWGNTAVRAWDVSGSYQNRGDRKDYELIKMRPIVEQPPV
ncbi:hypothetical protein FOZ63_029409 [Perkinsus olseni]|uniref:Transglutaminase-like domain-containing protein n=1 Tax=Perkinsus olseni TaxID=32597 RepID=A0A7J6QH32_PEROL|nr:hypothetical protein FOZ63_029409 [Perkinsus olseni]KAF4741550.1 hypothetical protein FOZ62_022619 [Perkinsus olseni]